MRKDLNIEQTAMSINMFCFSAFSNINTISKLHDKDLSIKAELEKRADHCPCVTYTELSENTLIFMLAFYIGIQYNISKKSITR